MERASQIHVVGLEPLRLPLLHAFTLADLVLDPEINEFVNSPKHPHLEDRVIFVM